MNAITKALEEIWQEYLRYLEAQRAKEALWAYHDELITHRTCPSGRCT